MEQLTYAYNNQLHPAGMNMKRNILPVIGLLWITLARVWNRSSSGRSLYQHDQHIPLVAKGKYKSTLYKLTHIFINLILLTFICVTVAWIPRTLNMLPCIAPSLHKVIELEYVKSRTRFHE